jgi:hypothetical protein
VRVWERRLARRLEMSHARAVIARNTVEDGIKLPVTLKDVVEIIHVIILTNPKV